VLSKN